MKKQRCIAMLGLLFFLTVFSGSAFAEKITKIDDLRRGAFVTVRGEVTRWLDEDEFRIKDDSGSIRIYIGWRNRITLNSGEVVTVEGFVDDDGLRPEIYARRIIRGDGKVLELHNAE